MVRTSWLWNGRKYSRTIQSKLRLRLHGFPLHQPRIIRMRRQKIEIAGHERQQLFARTKFFRRRCQHAAAKLPQKIFEHRAMQPALVAEVVVEHRLVGVRRRGDLLRARAGHSLRRKMLFRRGQNSPRRCRVLVLFYVRVAMFDFTVPRASCILRDTAAPPPLPRRNLVDLRQIRRASA